MNAPPITSTVEQRSLPLNPNPPDASPELEDDVGDVSQLEDDLIDVKADIFDNLVIDEFSSPIHDVDNVPDIRPRSPSF